MLYNNFMPFYWFKDYIWSKQKLLMVVMLLPDPLLREMETRRNSVESGY